MDHSAITYTRPTAAEEHSTRASFLNLPLEVLEYILPYLPPQTILSLSLVSKSLHHLIFPPAAAISSKSRHTLRPWRYLNLGESYTTPVLVKKSSEPLNNLPPSPPPSPPPTVSFAYIQNPETILSKSHILENVRTLILDGLPSVDAKLVGDILFAGDHPGRITPLQRIQILSIRGCPKLDDKILAKVILREKHFPKDLQGIYYFSDPELDFVSPSPGGADVFVSAKMGRMLGSARRRSANANEGGWWAVTLRLLRKQVAFDVEMCRGHAHFQYRDDLAQWEEREPRVATMRLTKGCAGCGISAETEDHFEKRGSGYGDGDAMEVLYPPAPVHNSSVASAKSFRHLKKDGGKVTLRCTDCLERRYCKGCGKWWCTPCSERAVIHPSNEEQPLPTMGAIERRQVVSLDCFECGSLCADCTSLSARVCENCRGCYCVIHNEGSDPQYCEWCIKSTSHRRRGSISAVSRTAPRRGSISIMSASSTSTRSEVDNALSAAAAFTDPGATASSSSSSSPSRATTTTFGQFSSPPTSPHLLPIPQPVILLSSRLPPPSSSSSSSASLSKLKAKGKGLDEDVKGAPASPILKAIASKGSNGGAGGEVHRAAGMRLRTMISGVANGNAGAGAGAGSGAGWGGGRGARE